MMKCTDCKTYHHEWCDIKHDSPDPDNDHYCRHFKQATNSDRIRSMTDEELADWLATITNPNTAAAYNGYCLSGSASMFLEWLQAESGEA